MTARMRPLIMLETTCLRCLVVLVAHFGTASLATVHLYVEYLHDSARQRLKFSK